MKTSLDKERLGYTSTTGFSSTQNLTNLAATNQKKPEKMVFSLSNVSNDSIYEKKINSFIEFLYKINLSNSIYVDLSLSSNLSRHQKKTFKVFVGPGNNS